MPCSLHCPLSLMCWVPGMSPCYFHGSPAPPHVRKPLLLAIKLNGWHRNVKVRCQGHSIQRQCGKLCVLPVSSQGGTRGCYYYGNQLFRNTFLFHHSSLLRPSWPPSPWDPLRRHFSSRGSRKQGCERICISTQWVPQCCKNHYGRDCRGKEA